jgi:predicted acylesterase/phospholipase RssA
VADALVGTSIGAANAAFLAAEPTLPQAQALSDLWRSVKPRQLFPFGPKRPLTLYEGMGRSSLLLPYASSSKTGSPNTPLPRRTTPSESCTHEGSRRGDHAPVEEVVRLRADLSIA